MIFQRKRSRWGSAWLLALAVFTASCAQLGGAHIKDVHLEPKIVVADSQKLLPVQLGYYMDKSQSGRTEVVGLGEAGNVRVHVGELLDGMMRENLRRVYQNLSVLPNPIFSEHQKLFDYPGVVTVEMDRIAINPADLTVKLSFVADFFVRGKRKVGEGYFSGVGSLVNQDPAALSPDEAVVLKSADTVNRLKLSVQLALKEAFQQFLRAQPELLKPVKGKDGIFFINPLRLPFDLDFKPVSPSHLADERSLKALDGVLQVMKENPDLRIRIEVHAFDYLNKVGELPPQFLAPERAQHLKEFLTNRGIAGGRIETFSYKDLYPLADNGTVAGWDRNDRVDFVVLR